MAVRIGSQTFNDSELVFASQEGQSVLYDNIVAELESYNQRINQFMQVFVERDTSDHKLRYKLPGFGKMSPRGIMSRGPAVKATGSWDVAFPLGDYQEAFAGDDVELAYMTARDLALHLQTISNRHASRVRHEILSAILNNAQDSFIDPIWGTLNIEPLANGDSVLYPPVLGSETEATENHYLESGYAADAISDTNNPYEAIRDEIEEHFGAATGGENIVVFLNNAQRAVTEDLSDFDEVEDRFIRSGDNVDVPINLPTVPGRILGRVSGVWAVEWRWIPANYLVALHLEAPRPLYRRVDREGTGLPKDLTLVAGDFEHPFKGAEYRARFGFGVANRLNGVVMELSAAGDGYTAPAAYS